MVPEMLCTLPLLAIQSERKTNVPVLNHPFCVFYTIHSDQYLRGA